MSKNVDLVEFVDSLGAIEDKLDILKTLNESIGNLITKAEGQDNVANLFFSLLGMEDIKNLNNVSNEKILELQDKIAKALENANKLREA